MMGFTQVMAVGSASVLAIVAPLATILSDGEKLGHMTASSILGVAVLTLVFAIVYMFKMFQKKRDEHESKLIGLIEENIKHMQASTDQLHSQTSLLVEIKDKTMKCNKGEN